MAAMPPTHPLTDIKFKIAPRPPCNLLRPVGRMSDPRQAAWFLPSCRPMHSARLSSTHDTVPSEIRPPALFLSANRHEADAANQLPCHHRRGRQAASLPPSLSHNHNCEPATVAAEGDQRKEREKERKREGEGRAHTNFTPVLTEWSGGAVGFGREG